MMSIASSLVACHILAQGYAPRNELRTIKTKKKTLNMNKGIVLKDEEYLNSSTDLRTLIFICYQHGKVH